MNPTALTHIVNALRTTNTAEKKKKQDEYNEERMQNVIVARMTRPEYIPIRHDLPMNGQNLPHSQSSEPLNHDVVVTGAISDGENRQVNFFRRRDEEGFVDAGKQSARLSLDALAGKSVEASGIAGVQSFPSPFRLRKKYMLTLEMFKTDVPAAVVHTVFTALRVFNDDDNAAKLTVAEESDIEELFAKYATPQPRYPVVPVKFNASGKASVRSPESSEPRLIYGFRATFSNAMVSYGFTNAGEFSHSPFPIWAMANEPTNSRQLYYMLINPIFVAAGEQLWFNFTNTIDGVVLAQDGQLEMLATTP